MWRNNEFTKLSDIELPIIQAPMAGSACSDMVVAVSQAGGLGSLACALLSVEQARKELETIHRRTSRPINVKGQERLENLLRACRGCGPAQIVSRILDDVLPFAKECPQKDDMTLLVVAVKDGVEQCDSISN